MNKSTARFPEFESYLEACYGDRKLPADQEKEVRQAFLSGQVSVLAEMTKLYTDMAQLCSDGVEEIRHELQRLGCLSKKEEKS